MGRKKKYNTEEEKKAARKAYNAKYKANNREKILEQKAAYRAIHKEEKAAYDAEYHSTLFGRAKCLESNYKRLDKEYNRGECTIDAQWILGNIFTQSCHYCGESDWRKLGCDRKDSSLPHTPENCVPCCRHCNEKKHTTSYDEFMKLIEKTKGA